MFADAGHAPTTPDAGDRTTTVVIVDDHRVFADSLAAALETRAGLRCLGTAPAVDEALPVVEEHRPDVVLMDAYLPRIDGIEGLRMVRDRAPESQVIMLTGHADLDLLGRAARAGAAGFLPKEADLDVVADAIRTVSHGRLLIDPDMITRMVEDTVRPAARSRNETPIDLTDRERQVLGLLAQGNDPASIAEMLGISVHTCRGHLKNLMMKMGVHSQLEAVVTAARLGMLSGHPLDS